MPPLAANPTRVGRAAGRQEVEVRRALGMEIKRRRDDAGVTLRRLAKAAGISHSLLSTIEAGDISASLEVLSRISTALGGRLRIQIDPGTGPLVRDHIQAAMLQGLLAPLHPRWRRFVDVPVYRPVRGAIDLVLDDPDEPVTIATEAQSELRRIEQQVRWATAKAEALRAGGNRELAAVLGVDAPVSRLLLLRCTESTRRVVATYPDLLRSAYPAVHADAVAALTGEGRWPGPALVWMDVVKGVGRLRTVPPRGISVGR